MSKIQINAKRTNRKVAKLLEYMELADAGLPAAAVDAVATTPAFFSTSPLDKKPPPAKKRDDGLVYFIMETLTGHVKIGVSGRPADRLQSLQTASSKPLVLMACIHGSYPLEKELHARFADRRVIGEWFNITVDDVGEVLRERLEAMRIEKIVIDPKLRAPKEEPPK